MNFLVCNRLCFPFLPPPLVVRFTRVRIHGLRVRETIVCLPVQLSRSLLSLCMCVSAVHVLPWGLNGFPTWSIVSRSLPFHPLAPRTPIRPSTPSRSFPFSRRAASGAATFPLSHFISRAHPKNRESREAGARRRRATRPPCTPSSDPLFPFVLLPPALPVPRCPVLLHPRCPPSSSSGFSRLLFFLWTFLSGRRALPHATDRSNPRIDLRSHVPVVFSGRCPLVSWPKLSDFDLLGWSFDRQLLFGSKRSSGWKVDQQECEYTTWWIPFLGRFPSFNWEIADECHLANSLESARVSWNK